MNDQRERDELQNDRAMGLREHGDWIDGDGHRCPLPCAGSVTQAIVLRGTFEADNSDRLARAANQLAADVGCSHEEASATVEAALSATRGLDLNRIIRVLDWLVADCCWRSRVDRPDGAMYGDDENYSPELRDAIALLADLRRLAGGGE